MQTSKIPTTMPECYRLTVKEVALRLAISDKAVYGLLERGVIPGIRYGKRRWIITRHAYGEWERTCGVPPQERTGPAIRGQKED